MDFSDLLGILDIFITVFVGFFLAHRLSVKDSRLRSVKDYYIAELSKIQQDTNSTFNLLLNEKISFEKLVSEMNDMECRLIEYEAAVYFSLPIKTESLQVIVGNQFDYITNLEEINNQCKKKVLKLSADTRYSVQNSSIIVQEAYANFIYQLNVNLGHSVWHELGATYHNCEKFYKANNKKYSTIRSLLLIIRNYILRYIIMVVILFLFIIGVKNAWKYYTNHTNLEQNEIQELYKTIIQKESERNNVLYEMMLIDDKIQKEIQEMTPLWKENLVDKKDFKK